MSQLRPSLFVVSDATAETAERTLRAALIQFSRVDPDVRIFSLVRTDERVREIMDLASQGGAMVIYTLVNPEQRALMAQCAENLNIAVVDLIDPLMTQLGIFFGMAPEGRPGLPRLNDEYFRRIEAVEFAVKHDDGQSPRQLTDADIVLVGISRTSKTPLSTFLAQKGLKVANVPIVLGLPLPKELDEVDQQGVFGLSIDVASLIRIRRSRLKALNIPVDTDYGRRDHILKEMQFARQVFYDHSDWPVIDVSQRAIEETAAIIMRIMDERSRSREEATISA
jgi:regulator of PEP synthase PpsR (kinase-PPPase family)